MKTKEYWLRLTCLIGAVVDAVAALMLMFPALNYFISGEPNINGGITYLNTKMTAVALMWGWTILLVWAARKPMERYGVLLITLFPVLSLLMGSRIFHLVNNMVEPVMNVPILILQMAIFVLAVFSLWNFHVGKDEHDVSH